MLHSHPFVLSLAIMGLMAQLGGSPIEPPPEISSQLSPDPKGWREFQWDMPKPQTREYGAETFLDDQGAEHFGLPDVEILVGKKKFTVDLQFFSHIGLSSILVKMKPHTMCAKVEYENLLGDLREKYGKEKEAKNLDYPNAFFLSHIWVVRTTKITLHHSCNKSRHPSSSNNSFLTSIHYEKRLFIELWDQ